MKTYNKLNFEIEKFADKFSNILVTKDKTVANDGRVLVEISTPDNSIENFPVIEGFKPSEDIKDFCLPCKTAKQIAKAVPNSKKLPFMNYVAIEQNEQTSWLACTDTISHTKLTTQNNNGNYPDYEKIFPTQQPAVKFMVNANILKDLCDIACKLSDTKTIQFDVVDDDTGIVLHANNSVSGQKMRALLMPCRIRE